MPALSAEPMSVDADQVAFAQIDLLAVPAEVKAQIKYAILDPSSWNTNAYVALLRLVEALAGAGLDVACAEAVASLPPKWLGPCISPYYPKGWQVHAYHRDVVPTSARGPRSSGSFYGETLPDALHAFATRDR